MRVQHVSEPANSSSYCQMREVTDEALQRLYWACRSKSGFPGDIPDESQGKPSTIAILNALGLKTTALEETRASEDLQRSTQAFSETCSLQSEHSGHLSHKFSSSVREASAEDEYLPSPTLTCFSTSSSIQSPKESLSLHNAVPLKPTTTHLDMSQQFLYATADGAASIRNPSISNGDGFYANHHADPVFDMNSFLDTTSCSNPSNGHLGYNPYGSMQCDIPMADNIIRSQPGTIRDGFLSPWPGSLAAAYTEAAVSL